MFRLPLVIYLTLKVDIKLWLKSKNFLNKNHKILKVMYHLMVKMSNVRHIEKVLINDQVFLIFIVMIRIVKVPMKRSIPFKQSMMKLLLRVFLKLTNKIILFKIKFKWYWLVNNSKIKVLINNLYNLI